MTTEETPQIQIDDDWKAQAQAEKDQLAAKEKEREGQPKRGQLPPADFKGLISMLASQAIMGLGAVPDQSGKGVMIDLEGSKFAIDLLAVIEEKTAGNLEDEEKKELEGVLTELRARFVQITQLLAQQAAATASPEAGGDTPKIILPD